MNKDSIPWKKWLPMFVFAVLLVVVFKTLDDLAEVQAVITNFLLTVSPFLYGVLIVYFLYLPCAKLEKLFAKSQVKFVSTKARLLSVLTVYLVLILLLVLISTLLVPILVQSLVDFTSNIPVYSEAIGEAINRLLGSAAERSIDVKTSLIDFSSKNLDKLLDPDKMDQYTQSVFVFASGMFKVVISLISSMYILLDREKIVNFFRTVAGILFKGGARVRLGEYLRQINRVLFTFVASKGLDSLINCVAVTLILLVFRVKYAFLLGLIAGLANFIPYLGSLVAVMFISVLAVVTSDLTQAGGFAQVLGVVIALIIFQQLDANLIEPKILGRSLKMSPLLIILAVVVGGAYFGILGMFLAVPVMAILKQVLAAYIETQKNRGDKGNL